MLDKLTRNASSRQMILIFEKVNWLIHKGVHTALCACTEPDHTTRDAREDLKV